jgi:peptidoglycan hydrolase-like protein with peptidoglycan-binding domain
MAISNSVIGGSVGLGGANRHPDVQLVQKLLNAVPLGKGGPMPQLGVDGLSGPMTCGAIRRFQTANVGLADGRIDPGRKTEQALLALLDALGVLAKLLGKPGTPGPTVPKPPPVGGPQSPIRRRFMAICQELLPAHGQLTAGQNTGGAKGTACGEFPGRVFTRVPVIPPNQAGAFKVMVPGVGLCYLTSPMIAWEQFAQAVDKQFAPARTWVPFGGTRPLPGDIYVLGQVENPARFQHVGVIVSAQGDDWTTADAGQGNGWQSGFVKRRFDPSGQIDGESGGKGKLRGWVNLDTLFAVAVAAFPANL